MSMKKFDLPETRLLTRAEVAEIFQVSPSTITRWAEAGKLPAVKTLGGHRRYEAKIVMELVQQLIQQEEVSMEKASITVPAMYGDHHVIEVRRLILEMPGVEEVNASSCFQVVDVSFDPAKVSIEAIKAKLDQAGYLEVLPVPAETATPANETNGKEEKFFRHTVAFEQTKNVVGFGQHIGHTGRPLWPCPGVGVIKAADMNKEVTHG
jgi:excisionase family DNA binding protein